MASHLDLGPLRSTTVVWPGKVRTVFVGWKGVVATFTLSRSGSVHTSLHRDDHPPRTKHWTRKRDHRKRMERMANVKDEIPTR